MSRKKVGYMVKKRGFFKVFKVFRAWRERSERR